MDLNGPPISKFNPKKKSVSTPAQNPKFLVTFKIFLSLD